MTELDTDHTETIDNGFLEHKERRHVDNAVSNLTAHLENGTPSHGLDDVRDRLSAMAVTALAYGALLRLEGMGDEALALEVLSQGLYDQADAVGAMSEEIEDGGNLSHVVVREELP